MSDNLEKNISALFESISQLIKEAKIRVAVTANAELTLLSIKLGNISMSFC